MTPEALRPADVIAFPKPASCPAGYRNSLESLEADWTLGCERDGRFLRGMAIALSLEAAVAAAIYCSWLAFRLFL
jgi:hypothetical protein